MSSNLDKDAHGNLQLAGSGALGDYLAAIVKKLQPAGGKKLRVRADTFGYLQRSFPGFTSEIDAREARLVGQMAAHLAGEGVAEGGSIAMRRKEGPAYSIETFLTPLSTVARETKHLDPSFIDGGNNITDAFKAYAAPLVGPLPKVGSFDELKG